jgi:hypothetical protein
MAASVKDLVKILTEPLMPTTTGQALDGRCDYDGLMERLKEKDPENPYFR